MDRCPQCRTRVPDGTKECPVCGVPLISDESVTEAAEHTVVPAVPPLMPADIYVRQSRDLGVRFVKFCLTMAIAVQFAACASIPFWAKWYFGDYVPRHDDQRALVLAGLVVLLLALFLAVANVAVFWKVHSLYDVQIEPKDTPRSQEQS